MARRGVAKGVGMEVIEFVIGQVTAPAVGDRSLIHAGNYGSSAVFAHQQGSSVVSEIQEAR